MKKLLILVLSTLILGCANSATIYSGDYFSISLGNSWIVEEIEMPYEAQMFTLEQKNGNILENGAILIAFDQNIDPEYLIIGQITGGNEMFNGGDFEDISDCMFLGVESAKTLNYTNIIKGRLHYCKIYCFVKNDITFFFTTYQLSKDNISIFDDVWNSFKFNDITPKSNLDVIDEIRATITTLNSAIVSNNGAPMGDNNYMIGVNLSDDNNCITYKYQLRDLEYDNLETEIFDSIKEEGKQSMLEGLMKDRDYTELVRKAMSKNISFKYEYYNRHNRLLYEVILTPEDYNNY